MRQQHRDQALHLLSAPLVSCAPAEQEQQDGSAALLLHRMGASDVLQVLHNLSSFGALIPCLPVLPFTALPLTERN